MQILGFLKELFGLGKEAIESRGKTKRLKMEQEHAIIEAETKAIVDRIQSNTQSDNEIDLITARNKRYTSKDDIITYLFLIPVVIASLEPFIRSFQNDSWISLGVYINEAYINLNSLPSWYKYILGLIVVDVLGFRSFARKVLNMYIESKNKK